MATQRLWATVVSLTITTALSAGALDEIPKDRGKAIEKAAPERPRVAPKKSRRVLIWVTPAHLMDKDPHKGYNIPYTVYAMRTLGEKSKAFEPVVSQDLTMFLPDKLKEFDAIVLSNTSGQWIAPSEEAMAKLKTMGAVGDGTDAKAVETTFRKSLLDWANAGGGIMAFHFAIGGNPQWPEFKELLGASYYGHPWNEEVGVKVEEPEHPLVAAFDGKDFRLTEEIFQFNTPYDRKKQRVLLSLDVTKTNMGVKWIERKDNDFALAWVRPQGKGRVFYTAFGHRAEIFWNPAMLQFYLDAIQFAAGDLEAPTAPR